MTTPTDTSEFGLVSVTGFKAPEHSQARLGNTPYSIMIFKSIHLLLVHQIPFPCRQLPHLLPRCLAWRLWLALSCVCQAHAIELEERCSQHARSEVLARTGELSLPGQFGRRSTLQFPLKSFKLATKSFILIFQLSSACVLFSRILVDCSPSVRW